MLNNNKQVEQLDTLIATTLDSVEGYRESSKQIDDPQLTDFFNQRATERAEIVGNLQSLQKTLGGEIRDEGSILGSAHRQFVGVKDAVTGGNASREAIINEIETGESYLVEKFETVLNDDDMTGEPRTMVQNAYSQIKTGYAQIEMLKDVETA